MTFPVGTGAVDGRWTLDPRCRPSIHQSEEAVGGNKHSRELTGVPKKGRVGTSMFRCISMGMDAGVNQGSGRQLKFRWIPLEHTLDSRKQAPGPSRSVQCTSDSDTMIAIRVRVECYLY